MKLYYVLDMKDNCYIFRKAEIHVSISYDIVDNEFSISDNLLEETHSNTERNHSFLYGINSILEI